MAEKRNQFTAPRKLSDGSRGDLRTHCEKFKMTAVDEKDMKMLSHIYRTIFLYGGSITVDDGTVKEIYKIGG